jgi:hypothetical protein
MNIDKITIIEKNKVPLEIIKNSIDSKNSLYGHVYNLINDDYLHKNYLKNVLLLVERLSLNYFFCKKQFYFYRDETWYNYLTDNLEIIKKDGKSEKAFIDINLAIPINKVKMVKLFKKCLLKHIKKSILEFVTCKKPEIKNDVFDKIYNFYEDYTQNINNDENSEFYKILLILCEYVFTHNTDVILYKDIDIGDKSIDELLLYQNNFGCAT